MARRSYKTALRAKGIRPLPPHHQMRTRKDGDGEQHEIFTPRRELAAQPPMLLSIGGRLLQLVKLGDQA